MKHIFLATALMTMAATQAQAFTCDPGGDVPVGTPYATSGAAGVLSTTIFHSSQAIFVSPDPVTGLAAGTGGPVGTYVTTGGSTINNAIPFCLANPTNTLAERQIFIYEANPVQSGVNPVADYKVLIDGNDVSSSFFYTPDAVVVGQKTGMTAEGDLSLTSGFHTLSIINLVQQKSGATFSGNGYSNVTVPSNYSVEADLQVSISGYDNIPLPEPASMAMFGVAIAGLIVGRRRRRI